MERRVSAADTVGGARPRVGLLHTVPALAATFHDLVGASVPGADAVHTVDAELLATAIRVGVTDEVRAQVRTHVRHLVEDGAQAVLVTCSSIGEAVEEAAADAAVPVLRVDAPMAREAVRRAGEGGRIAVLATLEATLGPTGRLIRREIDAAGTGATLTVTVVDGAADARAAGDQTEHDRLVREAVAAVAAGDGAADVIVLAQASMAAAIAGAEPGIPVLTSPSGGVAALAEALR